MTRNIVNINVVARADTTQARTAIRALSNQVRAANRDNAAALNVLAGSGLNTLPINRIKNDYDELTNKINRGKLSASEFGRVMRNSGRIIQRQSALNSAAIAKTGDAIRGYEHGVLVMDRFDKANIRMVDRVRLAGSSLKGLSTHVIDFGKNMQWAGRQITVGFSVPFAIAAGLAARQFMKLEDQVIRFEKVFNENLGTPLNEASNRVQQLAENLTTQMGRAAEETLSVAATFAQMGKTVEQVEELTRETMRLSTLGEIPVEQTTDLLRGIQAVYGFTNDELTKTVDLLNAIENNTSLTTSAMAESIPQILPIFEQFNLEIGQGVAIIAGMNEVLGNATEAVTAFKAVAQRIYDPSQEAIDKFASVGIDIQQIVQDNKNDLIGFYRDLGQVLADMNMSNDQFAATFGNLFGLRQSGRALTAVSAIYDQSTGAANDYSRALERVGENGENAADAQREIDAQLNSLSGRFRVIIEELKVEVADIGKLVMEIVIPVMEFVSHYVKMFNQLDDSVKKKIITISALVAAFGGVIMIGGIFANLLGNFMKLFGHMLPGMKMLTAETQASALALETEDMSARELLNTFLGLDVAIDNVTASQNALASATRNASSAMSAQSGRNAASGGYTYLPTGARKVGNQHAKYTVLPDNYYDDKMGKSRPKTKVQGTRGMWGSALMAGGFLGSQFASDPGAASIANTAMMLGMVATMGPALKGIGRHIATMVKGLGKAAAAAGSLIARLGAAGGMKSAFATGAITVGGAVSVVAAVAAIAVGFGLWRARITEANNELRRSARLSAKVAESAGIKLGGASLGFDEEATEEVNQARDVINAFHREMHTMRKDLGINLDNETEFKKVVFDIASRGDVDLATVKEIIRQGEINLGINLDVDTSSLEDLLKSLVDSQKFALESAFNRAKERGGTAGNISFGDRLQMQKINDDFKALAEEMANRMASALADPDMFKALMPLVQSIIGDVDDANFENTFVDMLIGLNDDIADEWKQDISTFDEFLALLAERSGGWARELKGEFDGDFLNTKKAKEELEASVEEISTTIENIMPGVGNNFSSNMQEIMDDFRDKVQEGLDEGKNLEVAIRDATDEMMEEIESMPEHVSRFASKFANLFELLGNLIGLEIGQADTEKDRRRHKYTDAFEDARMQSLEDRGETPGTGDGAGETKDTSGKLRSAMSDALGDLMDEVLEAIEKQRDERVEGLEEELKLLEEIKEEEEDRDKLLEERFRDQLERMRRLSGDLQDSIDYDAALARGDLDAAAQMNQERMFKPMEEGFEDFQRQMQERGRVRDEEFDAESTQIQQSIDEIEEFYKDKMELVKEDFELLQRTTPKTVAEWQERSRQIEGVLSKHGLNVHASIEGMAVDAYNAAMDNYNVAVAEDARWDSIAESMKAGVAKVGDAVKEETQKQVEEIVSEYNMMLFGKNFIGTELPDDVVGTSLDWSGQLFPDANNSGGSTYTGDWKDSVNRKKGGTIPGFGAVPAILHGGEYILNRNAVQAYGVEMLESMNAQKFEAGGLVGGGGGILGNMAGGFLRVLGMLLSKMTDMFGGALGGMFGGMFGDNSGVGAAGLGGGAAPTPGNASDIEKFLYGLRLHESGNQNVRNRTGSSASGYYQYVKGTWGGYGGYPEAINAPFNVQHERAKRDAMRAFNTHGSWAAAAVNHFYPAWADNPEKWHLSPTGGKYGNPPVIDYVKSVLSKAGLQLSKGGRLLENNVLANLHKGEAVLRAPVAKSLEAGIKNLEAGGGSISLTLSIGEFHGTEENIDMLAKKVERVLERKNDALGRKKVFG